jgi:murein L,D-transpeptidase YafK
MGNLQAGSILRWVDGGAVVVRSGIVLAFVIFAGVFNDASAQHAFASVLATDTAPARKPAKSPIRKTNFSKRQMANQRVLAARYEKRFEIKQLFRDKKIPYPAEEIFIRIFKRERQLEMWVRSEGQDTFAMLKRYEICALSDKAGPKRRQGDMQTPEGFYYIDDFNPRSGFHLSLHINYPNRADQLQGGTGNLGGDIFIHGGCKTEGCMAVTDENIKEIYWLAVEARDNGQERIPVHIFPTRLTDNNLAQLQNVFTKEPELVLFWTNLKPGYDYFAKYKKLPPIMVNARGFYEIRRDTKLLGEPVVAGEPAKAQTSKGN